MITRTLLPTALLLPAIGLAEISPYAGQETRAIKALSQEDIDGLLQGRGMQMAKPAELNSYPGPRHALELAKEIGLTSEQTAALEDVRARMAADAQRLGAEILEAEQALDRLFAERAADAAKVDTIAQTIGALQGRLRAVHLKAHLDTAAILTAHQIRRYDGLRGYTGTASHGTREGAAKPGGHSRH